MPKVDRHRLRPSQGSLPLCLPCAPPLTAPDDSENLQHALRFATRRMCYPLAVVKHGHHEVGWAGLGHKKCCCDGLRGEGKTPKSKEYCLCCLHQVSASSECKEI